ncbi:diguanylate cyclase [uncultured Desulfuromonas sp.]|uniref:GGDEF domain-containing response regulator n=1 Tax=uncultured Desulfuromonas sp. TaxID=181013 RepID=UPI002624A938|nr:diguanylate cyclase [uncultured Desulfuromonas sp.]
MTATSLIVGHSPASRKAIATTIKGTDLFRQILFSADSQEAFSQLKKHSVDMVFCDLRRLTGKAVDLFKRLAKQEEWGDIPVIAFTPEEDEATRIRGLELGASDCLSFTASAKEVAAKARFLLKIKERFEQLRSSRAQLAELALKDGLTGLYNRSYFDATLEKEIARSQRSEKSFSLVLLDLDHFKDVNDNYGHQAGDRVIQTAAKVFADSARNADVVCRYGGEEFAAILPETSTAGARIFSERIRKKVEGLDPVSLGIGKPITVSIGISCADFRHPVTMSELLENADRALYTAKNRGRNRVEIFTPTKRHPPMVHFPAYKGHAVAFA